jgi:methylthioribose-1-phosphate isomerase
MQDKSSINRELSPIFWSADQQSVFVIDQRLLPYKLEYVEIQDHVAMAGAIRNMTLRGAPLIGIAAAFGMALAAKYLVKEHNNEANRKLLEADSLLRGARPTAVNLYWALDQIQAVIKQSIKNQDNSRTLYERILAKAKWIHEDDVARCKGIGELGAIYLQKKFSGKKLNILTHCNTGALATGGYGTALGVVRSLHEKNLINRVFVNETRPRQQGARLTVWELAYDHIPVTLNTDNMAGYLMQEDLIDLVIVGADRIAANGDTANKIGTYPLAITAKYHNIPFYVVAPQSSIDKSKANGDSIPIETRDYDEVTHINDKPCTLTEDLIIQHNRDTNHSHELGEVNFVNPAFDITPGSLIEAIFTEDGLFV